ncbi:uncharacterized protein FOMMEDRAFT_135248 [Fomitiporia mediterranea MF3/22]|uniref:uncharacterized protein n=1 Tax=Fomitiporia mediterranea (strain MF3/22) TaxID=694068 RepID=UPI0004408485|nr:uncharacterized protein FOMMEDRAFT_135248 [Fomitiporia mediterranea MF3/22]EJD00975.1 hypothetical protein FOMMEDRAFT_135248 [Fomitiporia mediterranea MF3/22]
MGRLNVLWVGRIAVFAVVLLFSIIILGLSANYIAQLANFGVDAPAFAALALAISLITFLAFVPMLAIDFIRSGAITSWVAIELGVTGLLAILWLASAATTASASDGQTVDCSVADRIDSTAGTLCHSYQAIEAFGFLNWIILTSYFSGLLVMAILAQLRQNKPWTGTVRDTNFFARKTVPAAAPMQAPMQQPWPTNAYPPAQGQPVHV